MTFLSPAFLFIFMPISVIGYALMPKFRRSDILPIISSVFFVCINIHDLLSLLYYLASCTMVVAAVSIYKKTKKEYILIALELITALGAIVTVFYRMVRGESAVYHAGMLICFMSIISLCSDIRKGDGRVPDSPWDALVYVTFFPTALIGPFVKYGDFVEKLDDAQFTLESFNRGTVRFLIGFVKCLAVSSMLGQAYDRIRNAADTLGLAVFLLLAVILGLRVYAFFSGYSDMSRGLALMLGIEIGPDFSDPFLNTTPAAYIRHFLKSFSSFFKQYVVSPINELFAGSFAGKLVSCLLAGSFYVFIVCRSADAAVILLIPAALTSYFVMFKTKKSEMIKLPKWLGVLSAIFTFFGMSLAFMTIKLGDIATISETLISVASVSPLYVSHQVLEIIMNLKYIIVPSVSAVILSVISRVLCKKNDKENFAKGELIVHSVASAVLLAVFVIAVIFLLPQFPELTSFENGFYFI